MQSKEITACYSQNRKVHHSTLDGSYIKQKRIMRTRQALFIRLVRNLESTSMFAIGEEWNAENRLSFFFLFLFLLLLFDCFGESEIFKKRKHMKNQPRTRITQKSAYVFIYISLTHVLRLQSLNLRFHQSFSMQLSTQCSKRQFITKIFFTERF